MSHANYSNRVQVGNGNPVESMESFSSAQFKGGTSPPCLLPAPRVIRHPPPRACSRLFRNSRGASGGACACVSRIRSKPQVQTSRSGAISFSGELA
jgi:hypothetical protein